MPLRSSPPQQKSARLSQVMMPALVTSPGLSSSCLGPRMPAPGCAGTKPSPCSPAAGLAGDRQGAGQWQPLRHKLTVPASSAGWHLLPAPSQHGQQPSTACLLSSRLASPLQAQQRSPRLPVLLRPVVVWGVACPEVDHRHGPSPHVQLPRSLVHPPLLRYLCQRPAHRPHLHTGPVSVSWLGDLKP